MADFHKNFAYSTVTTAPSPATTGTELVVGAGQGALFPTPPFNATVWPTGVQPISTNAEVVRVTKIVSDTFTIIRAQEGSTARTVIVGDQIAATITDAVLRGAENVVSTWSPYILASAGQALQTLATSSGQSSSGSLLVFPVTIPGNLQFNQIIVPNSLSYITSAVAAVNNTYRSLFGLYSRNANTLSLISSNSFSIGETLNSVSLTWNYPTTTQTAGYGYGSFPAGNLTATAQMVSYISATRGVGLQFGANMSLTGGLYWLGLMSGRTTGAASSTLGLSHAGIYGQIIASMNQAGTGSGLLPIGHHYSNWSLSASNFTGWWGRHIGGFVTATSIANFGGTIIPPSIELSALQATQTGLTVSVLPTVTFVST